MTQCTNENLTTSKFLKNTSDGAWWCRVQRKLSLHVDTMSTAASEGYRRRKAYVCGGSEQHSQQVQQRQVAIGQFHNE